MLTIKFEVAEKQKADQNNNSNKQNNYILQEAHNLMKKNQWAKASNLVFYLLEKQPLLPSSGQLLEKLYKGLEFYDDQSTNIIHLFQKISNSNILQGDLLIIAKHFIQIKKFKCSYVFFNLYFEYKITNIITAELIRDYFHVCLASKNHNKIIDFFSLIENKTYIFTTGSVICQTINKYLIIALEIAGEFDKTDKITLKNDCINNKQIKERRKISEHLEYNQSRKMLYQIYGSVLINTSRDDNTNSAVFKSSTLEEITRNLQLSQQFLQHQNIKIKEIVYKNGDINNKIISNALSMVLNIPARTTTNSDLNLPIEKKLFVSAKNILFHEMPEGLENIKSFVYYFESGKNNAIVPDICCEYCEYGIFHWEEGLDEMKSDLESITVANQYALEIGNCLPLKNNQNNEFLEQIAENSKLLSVNLKDKKLESESIFINFFPEK